MTYKLAKTSQDADQYFGAVSLLLDGTDLQDKSLDTKTVTAVGDAQVSTAQSKFGGSSIAFDGTGDYLVVADSDDFYLGGDFTIEGWVYLTSAGSAFKYIFAQWLDGGGTDRNFSFNSLGEFYMNRSGSTFSVNIGTIPVGSWTFISVSLQSTTLRGFKNGVLTATTTVSGAANNSTEPFGVGAYGNGDYPFDGYIDDFRITKGVARYTANFTPPTQPFTPALKTGADQYFYNTSLLIHGDGTNGSTNIVDSSYDPKAITVNGDAQISTAQSKFGGSSIAFDGNGDYLSIPDNDDWDISGDYTVEFWARMPAQSTASYTIGYFGTTAVNGTSGFAFGHFLGTVLLNLNGSVTQSSTVLLTNTWQHIALVISGASAKVYVDGISVISTTSATTTTSTSFIVGNFGNLDPNRYFNGYIDDFRITKGVARYTSNFTPPIKAFPNY